MRILGNWFIFGDVVDMLESFLFLGEDGIVWCEHMVLVQLSCCCIISFGNGSLTAS